MITFPNAKINLGLRVIEKRPDGYHNLETVFYPVELCDALDVVKSRKFGINISGIIPDGSSRNNLVVKAYHILKEDFDLPPVNIHLHKNIPNGAGLGGGSSNGAFMLKTLNSLFSLNLTIPQLEKYALKLGADCPFFIRNTASLATGIGNILTPVNVDLSDYRILLVKPSKSVSTFEAYSKIVPFIPLKSLTEILNMPIRNWQDYLVNDFEESVFKMYPEIQKIKDSLYEMGAIYASMTGSGSAVFGLFRSLPVKPERFIPKGSFIYR